MTKIYLDYAAATPMSETVLAAMQPYFSERFYNPSALYLDAKAVSGDITQARASVAHWFGARPSEIIFTAGGTEANNLAIHGVMKQFPDGNIVISAVEHDAVMLPARDYDCRIAPVLADGRIDLAALTELIDDKTVLLSVMYANNEVGTIQPIREVSRIVKTKLQSRQTSDYPLYLHTDACQAPAYLDIHAARLGVDMMTINGGKIYGPKQSGALYVKTGTQLTPLIKGGGQELNYRSGTENVAGIIGLATALDMVQQRRVTEVERVTALRDNFINDLQKTIPSAIINGSLRHRLPNNIHVTIPGTDNERLLMALDEKNIICGIGSACSASKEEPSRVLGAMGISDEAAYASLRFSLGHSTSRAELKQVVKSLSGLL